MLGDHEHIEWQSFFDVHHQNIHTRMNPPNYGCAFVHSLLPASALKSIDDANPSTRDKFCGMMQSECAKRHTSEDAIKQCVLLSSTGKFNNQLIQSASSIEDVANACCRKHPAQECFYPPNGITSSCSAAEFLRDKNHATDATKPKHSHYGHKNNTTKSSPSSSSSTECAMSCNDFENAHWDDLDKACRKKITQCNRSRTAEVDAERSAEMNALRAQMQGGDSPDGSGNFHHAQNAALNGPVD